MTCGGKKKKKSLIFLVLNTGSVFFTSDTITWYLPWHISPLISSEQFRLLEVHVGIDGVRLHPDEMAARRYSLTVDDDYIILQIPVGAVGGFFKVCNVYNVLLF